MTTAALIAKAKLYALRYGADAQHIIHSNCEMLAACERRTTTLTAAVHYRTKLERFIEQQEAKEI